MHDPEINVTLNYLVDITGKHFKTIKKRLAKLKYVHGSHGALLYDLKEALKVIIDGHQYEPKRMAEYRCLREKSEALLAQAKAEKIRLEVKGIKKIVIPSERAETFVSNLVINFKSKLLALPSRCALRVAGCGDPNDVEHLLTGEVNTVLTELSEIDFNELFKSKKADSTHSAA